MQNNNEQLFEESEPNKEKFSDEKTQNKVHQHLSDATDIISDEDIKSIRTDVGKDQTQGLSEDELKNVEEKERQNKKDDDDDDDHPFISSYNILGS